MKFLLSLMSLAIFCSQSHCLSENDSEKSSEPDILYSELWHNSTNRTSNLLLQNFKYVLENKFSQNQIEEQDVKESEIVENRKSLLSKRLQLFLPPFVVTKENVRNERCIKDSNLFLEELNNLKLWALKMHDASGKLPSGILDGNVNQFGDFDQCVNVNDPITGIKGKYCLAYLQISLAKDDYHPEVYNSIHDLMHSHFAFKSKLTDPGHRVPRYSTTNWALCVPSSCSSQDVESELKKVVDRYSNGTGFDVEVRVESEMCQVKRKIDVSTSFLIVGCIFLAVIAVSIFATIKDFLRKNENPNNEVSIQSIIDCFSLKRNVEQLISLKRAPDDIESVHGIRMINAIMLVISHKSMALFFIPYTNRTYMAENLGQTWSVVARAASLYTDPFIMISGILTSYSFIKTLKKNQSLDLKKEYSNRLLRIIPPLAAVILLCTFILPELGSGPMWNLTVTHHANMCKNYWWRNFLFIHNYFGFENMCLTHTHHLGIDTQLFFISPILVLILYKWPLPGLSTLISLAAVSTAMRYQTTIARNLSYFVYPGASITQLFDTANYSYIIPSHRLTVYILGIILGYALHYCGREYKLKPSYRKFGWMIALTLIYFSFIKTSNMSRHGYVYNNLDAGLYAALAPIGWCLFFAWIIFISHIGYGGILGKLLSSKYCIIWTRLSYAVYLTQFPVYFFNVGMQRAAQPYTFFLMVSILEYGAIILASLALTLFFDFPFNNLKKLIIRR